MIKEQLQKELGDDQFKELHSDLQDAVQYSPLHSNMVARIWQVVDKHSLLSVIDKSNEAISSLITFLQDVSSDNVNTCDSFTYRRAVTQGDEVFKMQQGVEAMIYKAIAIFSVDAIGDVLERVRKLRDKND